MADRVVEELGGPPGERDARVLITDAWLGRMASGAEDPAAYDHTQLESLHELGGAYDWFRLAIYDLEVLDAVEDGQGRRAAVEEMRLRAGAVLRQSVEERLAAPAPSEHERPFLRFDPPRGVLRRQRLRTKWDDPA